MHTTDNSPQLPHPAARRSVLVIDHSQTAETLCQFLRHEPDTDVLSVDHPMTALQKLQEGHFSAVITNVPMPDMDGLEFLRRVQRFRNPVPVIALAAIEQSEQAIPVGACAFLATPVDPARLRLALDQACREFPAQQERCGLREQMQSRYCYHTLISRSPKMHAVFELIEQVASTTATVLIEGETGTGKEEVARSIHAASLPARQGAFVAVNCAAVNENLLESELFGHEKGSYTGAMTQRKGRFEQAHGGTIFLDEVGDVPASMQVKLLRVLQERNFERVGGAEPIHVDVRVVAATNRDLRQLVQRGAFREDLYYRLDVVRIELPPLRESPEDIPLLAAHFARKHAQRDGEVRQISPAALEVLMAHSWPGNIRELENVIECACVTARGSEITPEDLPSLEEQPGETAGFRIDLRKPLRELLNEVVARIEREYLVKALRKTRGHVGKSARLCGYSRRSITGKLAEYHIKRDDFVDR